MKAWENNIRKVIPYVPGEQPKKEKMIKLNTNENPYPPAPGVKDVLTSFDTDRLRLYPDPKIEKLTDAIAERYGLNSNQVFVGVGSDDVLAMCFCFRILLILSMMSGQRNSVFHISRFHWMGILRFARRIMPGKTEGLYSQIQTHRQESCFR